MKKQFLTMVTMALMAINANAQEVCTFNPNNAFGLDSDNGTALAAGTVIGETQSIIATVGADDTYKPQSATFTVNGTEIAAGYVFSTEDNVSISSDGVAIIGEGGNIPTFDVWTVAGDKALFGSDWDVSSNNMRTYNGEDYSLTKNNLTLPKGTYEYKVFKGHSTQESYPSSNAKLVIEENATYSITFTFNASTKELSATATKTDGLYYNFIEKGKVAEVIQNPNKYKGTVIIPSTVTYEGQEYTVTKIADNAFNDCRGLTSVTIPNSVTSIGDYAFRYCGSLTSVTIPNSVTSIGGGAFDGCSGLTSVTIPNSVNSIGNGAFSDCSGLTSVTIPNSVTSIGSGTFEDCSGLISFTIPNSVTSIGSSAFNGCSGLASITIPNSVTSIGSRAFAYCSDLTSVTIPNSVTSIGWGAFADCSSLTSVTIPNSVTSIVAGVFEYCSGLTSVTIPNSVTSIGEYAFAYCSGLTSITIGSGIKYIYNQAFANCPELTDVYCYAENVPSTNTDAFEDSYIEYATLHVSKGCLGTYKDVEPWKSFKSILEMVDAKVKLSKTKTIIEKGKTLTLKATITPSDLPDKSVTWESSNTKVATVTSAGKVKGVKTGTATITCTSNSTGAKATCKVYVGCVKLDKTEAAILKGKTTTLTATVYPTSLKDKSVTWESSNTAVATVTSAGKVDGVEAGTAIITCTSNATGLKATCTVNVVNGFVNLNKAEAYVEKGKTKTLKATVTPETLEDKSVTWESSDPKIVKVSSAGKIKGVKYGTATITCTSVATGAKATCQVTVGKVIISMSEFSLKRSRTNMLTATVYPTDLADKSVIWESSDTQIATVTSKGKVKGIAAGTATITCTSVATGLKGTCTVTVLSTSEARSMIGDDDDELTGLKELESPAVVEPFDVYDLSGRKVRHQVTSLDGLSDGIYIVNGKKVLKKK